jgi:hypothetical protein
VNVFTHEILDTSVAMRGDRIIGLGERPARAAVDLGGRYVCPGLIDAHVAGGIRAHDLELVTAHVQAANAQRRHVGGLDPDALGLPGDSELLLRPRRLSMSRSLLAVVGPGDQRSQVMARGARPFRGCSAGAAIRPSVSAPDPARCPRPALRQADLVREEAHPHDAVAPREVHEWPVVAVASAAAGPAGVILLPCLVPVGHRASGSRRCGAKSGRCRGNTAV